MTGDTAAILLRWWTNNIAYMDAITKGVLKQVINQVISSPHVILFVLWSLSLKYAIFYHKALL